MFYTYILANRPKGTLYIGHTDDLRGRLAQHVAGEVKGLTPKHRACKQIMWFETHTTRSSSYERLEQIKGENRSWVIKRLRLLNPKWDDLKDDITDAELCVPERAFPSDTAIPVVVKADPDAEIDDEA